MKQRKTQQREMLRVKAVLDRRTQAFAEKEKEKKEVNKIGFFKTVT